MTEVYFVRHAEPDLSIHEDFIRPLSNKGKKDAYNLVTFFNDKKIDAVLSSPFLRTIDTVRNIAFKFQVEIQTVDDFRERKIDGWIDDFNSYTKNQWLDFNYKLKSGESLKEVQCRNINALTKVLNEYNGQTIVIGTHGTALSTIINYYDHTYGYEDFIKIKNQMPLVVKMVFEDEKCISITTEVKGSVNK
ncbi:histidine phosphatase family protein [Inconstantimicrobium porci]|uniref:Histidine phosphatase family protein n=2 Tax=Inconstantimicrobium porci TaxID=2652291 RepID=A0A7X2MZZ9_9CLOT|nr:histidine phosphatase family protein [Inconstantimicrobium porci]MSR92214.1 histidine phosphatase family protein [Inconstantimicrobium porci]